MRWPEIAARLTLIFGSAFLISADASAWASAPVGLLAIAATVELAVRPYARNPVDRVLIGCGAGVVGLILLGVGLNLTPSGLTRVTWTVTWVVLGLAVLLWRRNGGLVLSQVRLTPSAFWAVPIVVVLVAAGFVAHAGSNDARRPELALSLRSKSAHAVAVEISATSISGRYRLTARAGDVGATTYASPAFTINAGQNGVHIVKQVPADVPSRWTITLASMSGGQARELIVDVGSASNAWVTTWVARFAGPDNSRVNPADWQYALGRGFGDGEVERMSNALGNVHLDGHGDLVITPLRHNGYWTSGRVQTTQTFLFAPGGEYKVSASIMQPNPANGTGYWPAFWMVAPGTRMHTGEIDVLEDINGSSRHSGNFHCGYYRRSGNLCQSYGLTSGLQTCPQCQVSYNTYSVVIDRRVPGAEVVSWYLNDQEFFSISESSVGDAMWTEALSRPFTIILDVGIGGGYPNSRCHCNSPLGQTSPGASMQVQYVMVSKQAAL